MSLYEFGPFQLDAERLLLLHAGDPIALGPKVVETLLALIEHPSDVLAKNALLDRIWPDGFVEEANLAQNIYVLRKTLRCHWDVDAIETVPRRGYRFVAPVCTVEHKPSVVASARAPEPVRFSLPRPFVAGVAGLAFLAVSMIAGLSYGSSHRTQAPVLSNGGARLYAIGRYYWNLRTRDGIKKSLVYFSKVIDTDPRDARGYAALAESNALMADYKYGSMAPKVYMNRASAYARKALSLDEASAEAHAALGLIDLDRNQTLDAIAQLQRAIAADPSYGAAHEWYGIALLNRNRLHDAVRELRLAADLDPLSVATTAWLGSAAYLDHHFDDAIAYSRQALDLSPQRADLYAIIGEAYEAQGNYPRAIEAYSRYANHSGDSRYEGAALLAHAYALVHRMGDA
ncbi:MAG: winged helix-turn-helix domain-containing protein, partial [Candidatus Eremiobacteraeota bacterium]|nr:winged helix-turn-helix domain-containing protein [Candidatus Eremiobacteraeota bacterium]